MDDTQRIVKCGNLSLHSTGGFFKKRWHSKYLVLYDGSKSGVKRLELFDSEIKFKKQQPAKIIPLVDCVRVVTCQRNKTTYTFEVRTSDQFYLLAGQSFQDMNDWVNCLRLVAFGQQAPSIQQSAAQQLSQTNTNTQRSQQQHQISPISRQLASTTANTNNGCGQQNGRSIDVLLEKRNLQTPTGRNSGSEYLRQSMEKLQTGSGSQQAPNVSTETHPALVSQNQQRATTASQAAASAAIALAKTRQRQPSLLGSCKPQPPTDSPFIQQQQQQATGGGNSGVDPLAAIGQLDTLTPTVRGQLIAGATKTPLVLAAAAAASGNGNSQQQQLRPIGAHAASSLGGNKPSIPTTLDEEEENMLYCSIEDNPSEHNYRVKVIETELSLRCQLKCYQLTAPTTINQQYEQLGQFNSQNKNRLFNEMANNEQMSPHITFYQLIIGPQELTLLNDYAALTMKQQQASLHQQQQQGLWSWPYQCIRRYGFDKDNCFMFEAGRKCTSGPGQFIVQTPKAYSIYQDVVKFVNELRSLSTTDVGNSLPAAGNSKILATTMSNNSNNNNNSSGDGNQQSRQLVVTQIPVTWTPVTASTATATGAIKVDTVESRHQFFNTLRQLDNSSSGINQAPASGQTTTIATATDRLASRNSNIHNDASSQSPPSTLTTITSNSASMSNSNKSNTPTITTSQTSLTTTHHKPSNSPVASTDTLQSSKSSPSLSTSPSTGSAKDCNSVASPEETDESGYEQGDDSVDSGSKSTRFKMISANARKRQAQDSMSSASSTSSGGGSPGHSVSRRSNGAIGGHHQPSINGQGPSKRPPLHTISGCSNQTGAGNTATSTQTSTKTTSTGAQTTVAAVTKGSTSGLSQNHKLLGMLVGGVAGSGGLNQPEDFEANLIRDVYSEITKLHAKFAVARGGSAEDSLSNNSSNEESTNSSDQSGPSEMANDSGMGNGNCNRSGSSIEPMYSNLRMRRARGSNRVADLDDDDDDEVDDDDDDDDEGDDDLNGNKKYFNSPSARPQQYNYQLQNDQFSHQRGGLNTPSYVQNNNFDNCLSLPRCGAPIYPTMLNPIPECGEVTPQQPLTPNHNKSPALGHNNNGKSNIVNNRMIRPSSLSPREESMNESKKSNRSNVQQSANQLKSKLPTNHYVINDVQYAKISRNVCSKYESCL